MNLALDPQNPAPLFRQLADALRREISRGTWRPGERVPTVRELAVMARVNRNTASRAIQALEAAGLVSSRVGQGTFVTEQALSVGSDLGRGELDAALDAVVRQAARDGIPLDELRSRLADRIAAFRRAQECRESNA